MKVQPVSAIRPLTDNKQKQQANPNNPKKESGTGFAAVLANVKS